MSDIQKLHEVISTLEEQSSKVSEFNGVLIAVKSANADINSAKLAFDELAQEQKKLVSESYTRFSDYGDKLVELEAKLSGLERNQQKTLAKLTELKVLTPEQFETGRDKVLHRMSELRFVTPEHLEQSTTSVERSIAGQLTEGNVKLEGMIAAQAEQIKTLRIFLVLGMLVLAGGIAFL